MTPMMQQYFEIKDKYREYILMYRLGDFYEMFFEDAKVASAELELTLTGFFIHWESCRIGYLLFLRQTFLLLLQFQFQFLGSIQQMTFLSYL